MKDLVGRLVVSTAGHDADMLYVVMAQESGFVYLTDGKYHPLEKQKKKSIKHISAYKQTVPEELYRRIINKEEIFNHEIKYAIKILREGKEEGYVKE
ncbi:MAG: KOW domain-containing RNA-binding protein [Lachnospiraceae bacterium]|nr:KOW domain-containing RNA-binding protein [Lachnospiraceae bacterium]MBR4085944.1 KOW domain-containing RNA-binding protein [Lachnospiraceae bacterium]